MDVQRAEECSAESSSRSEAECSKSITIQVLLQFLDGTDDGFIILPLRMSPCRVELLKQGGLVKIKGSTAIMLGKGSTAEEAEACGWSYFVRLCKWHGQPIPDYVPFEKCAPYLSGEMRPTLSTSCEDTQELSFGP